MSLMPFSGKCRHCGSTDEQRGGLIQQRRRALPIPTSTADAPLAACVTALEGVLRVADRKTDEFDAARSALSAARAYLGRT